MHIEFAFSVDVVVFFSLDGVLFFYSNSFFSPLRESFPYEDQFSCIIKFLNDQTQTPNTKVSLHHFTIYMITFGIIKFETSRTYVSNSISKEDFF